MSYKLADGSLSTDYEVGDEFILTDEYGSLTCMWEASDTGVGDIVVLVEDDGSVHPYFSNGKSTWHEEWECVIPTEETKQRARARKAKFPITSGDYIDSREFTREECERFCELAVECGAKKDGPWMYSQPIQFYYLFGWDERDGKIYAYENAILIWSKCFTNNITTNFREFLDKEKGMKQFTKDALKDGQRVFLEDGATTVNGLFNLTSKDPFYVCGDNAIMPVLNDPSPYLVLSELDENLKTKGGQKVVRIEERDGTVLFKREEKRKVTFELTEEQERELRKQLDQ